MFGLGDYKEAEKRERITFTLQSFLKEDNYIKDANKCHCK